MKQEYLNLKKEAVNFNNVILLTNMFSKFLGHIRIYLTFNKNN